MDVARHHRGNTDDAENTTIKTALVLRSKAQTCVSKYAHAKADLKRLLSMEPEHAEGKRLMNQLERTVQQNKKSEKKLVKELCKWVDVATSQSVSEEPYEVADNVPNNTVRPLFAPQPRHLPWLIILITAFIAYYLQTKL